MHKDWTFEQWSRVIFIDESKFCVEFGDRTALVWRTKNERYNPACLNMSVKFPTCVMVWGCVSTRRMGNVVFLKLTVTADVYMEVLESHLVSSIEDLYDDEGMIFQHIWLLHTP